MPMVNFPLESKESRSRISVSKATGKTRVVEKIVNEVDSIRKREQTHMVPEEEEAGRVVQAEDEKEEGEILEEDESAETRAGNSAQLKVVVEADGAKEDLQGQVSHCSPCDMEVDDRAVAAADGGKEVKEKSGERVKHRHRDLDIVKEGRSKDAKVRGSDRKHHRDARDDKAPRRSPSRDRLKRGRSKSPEQARSRESSRERREPAGSPAPGRERRKRSRSPDSIRAKISRRHRSRSRESGRERTHGRGRSRSPDAGKEKRLNVDSIDRRRRSVSRDSRCLKGNNESSKRSGRSRSRGRSPCHPEKRRRSRSRDSVRERRGNDDRGGRGGDENRYYRDERSARDGYHQLSHRDRTDRERDRDRGYHSDRERRREGDRSRKKRKDKVTRDEQSRDGKGAEGAAAHFHRAREEENQNDYQERVASQLAAQEEDDVEKIKEQSRLRRQAILAKYEKQSQQNQITRETEEINMFSADTQVKVEEGHASYNPGPVKDDEMPQVAEEANGGPVTCIAEVVELGDQASNASISFEKIPSSNGAAQPETTVVPGGLGGGSPKSERSTDMFCDDIFGESPAGGHRVGKGDGIAVDTSGLNDNWDDAEGYYCFRVGEILDGRYEVVSSHGRGVFSTVVRARDMKAGRGEVEEVAIKIIRNNETMYKAGQEELVILKKLAGADPENRRHCVRLLSSFVYRNHLCLVFESLHMNLREILKKFGRNIGINLNAVRAYAKQLFIALKHLRNCGVLHCDIKPDNMLVNEAKNVLKLCDFGSAMFAGENEITPYLVSRFYRPPEIILGLPYDHALDIWSVGCCLFELYSGKMLYPGATNNDMLRLHMELMGPFPKKMLKKAAFADQHFDQDYNFCAMEEDPVTKKTVKRILVNVRPKDMGALISGPGAAEEDTKLLANFKDLLEKIFILDPDKRIAVSQALNHPFITGK